jgi:DNA-binding response OmpR family regulator
LAISREYIELHGGNILVESTEKEGSCFSIYIPKGKEHFKNEYTVLATQDIAEEVQNLAFTKFDHSAVPASENETNEVKSELPLILVIEDSEELLLYLKQTLSENYRVLCAPNGDEGYILAGEHNPDLIITDLSMPGMDGIDLCEHLKSELPTCHIPIIILTARVSDESNIRGLETGADVYINKPFNIHILKAQIKSLLDSRQRLKSIMAKELVVQPKDVTVASLDERFLAKLMEVVEEHASDQTFGIKELTEKMNMSHSVIFRKIKSITGLTVVDYIRTFRLKKAALILTKKKLPISEVSFMVGFSDPKYFSKCFQKEFGLSPTEYATRNKTD